MQSYTRRSSTLGWQGVLWGQPTLGVALLATCLLLVGTAGASAAYVDSFNSAPFTGVVTSFTTGSSSTGVSYTISGGDGGDFAWRSNGGDGGSGTIDILSDAVSAAVEKVTIESRDGKAFVFTSLWCDVMGDGWTIKGEGPEPFTMTAGTGTSATKSPSGGAKLVTSIEITSTDFYDDYLDTVTLQLDVPGAAVYGEGRLITNGDSTPSSTNGTDLGETPVGTPVTQDFELENIGDAALTVDSSVTVTGAGFSIAQQPSSPIAPGGSSTFTVQFDPSSSGTVTGTVTVDNNSEADDYTFAVTGEGTADTDPPGLTAFERQTPGTQDTNADSLVFRATFDEDVQYVTTGDFAVTGTTATDSNVNAVSAAVYDLTVSGGDLDGYDGTVGINLSGTQNIADLWDNPLPAGEPGTDETYQMDNTSPTDPTPTSSSHTVSVWNNDATIDIQISGASDTGSGVDGFEVEWDQSATWTPSETKEHEEVWAGATYTATSNGDWYFHIATVDNVGNWTSTEHLGPFRIDTTPPSVPTGLDPADGSYTTETSPILSWNASTDTGGSGIRDTSAYRIVVTGPSGRDTYVSDTDYNPTDLDEGTYTWRLYARDNAGNSSSYTADTTLVIDATQPDVTLDQAAGQADPTNASPVVFTAVFDEPIDEATFTDADVSVDGTATTGTVTVTEVAPHDDTTFEVSIAVTGNGTVVPTIPAGGIEDYAGNTNTASTSSDNSVTYDGSKPSVTIEQAAAQVDPANASPALFTVVFDEPIHDATFTNADVSVGGTATTGLVTVTEVAPNDDTTFEVSVVVTGDGTVVPTIPAGGVEDPFGNTNNASTSTDNSVTVDTMPPINPTLTCTTHTVDMWSANDTIRIEGFDTASDALTGISEFYIWWVADGGGLAGELAVPSEVVWIDVSTDDGIWYLDCETRDAAGNATVPLHVGPFKIDTTAPAINGNPGDQTVSVSHGAHAATVTWSEPTATDGGCGLATLVATHHPGDVFPIGTTTVIYTATDELGNSSTETFDVVVIEQEEVLTIEPMGSMGDGGYLDRCLELEEGEEPPMVGSCPLAAIYEVGEVVTGACQILNPGGHAMRASYVHVFIYSVDIESRPEEKMLLNHWVARYNSSAGGYTFSWDTTDVPPGYYDVYLSFTDGSSHTCRIQLVEPEEP